MIDHLHFFKHNIENIPLPTAFTYPFYYTPHQLTQWAAEEVQEYILSRADWNEEINNGKMFGVLIVRTPQQQTAYLAAFSGILAGSYIHSFFVPPIYDLLNPNGFFREEEAKISAINHHIEAMRKDEKYLSLISECCMMENDIALQLKEQRVFLKASKENRKRRREKNISFEEEKELIKESQFQKAEYKRLERRLKLKLEEKKEVLKVYETQLSAWKEKRKKQSAELQQRIFTQFNLLNAKGESKNICDLFKNTPQQVPPSGAGECALPKLLQYAYIHRLQPLAMGEFWWGKSPKETIRHQGKFYPACKGKCEPILKHMLIGLTIEQNPLCSDRYKDIPLNIVYEDNWLIAVNKPAGMLSVPGKNNTDSVFRKLKELYPEATGPLVVHRLDMATSGLLLAAKDKITHQKMQQLFEKREIQKKYIALLEGIVNEDEGIIELPICPDYYDSPRQKVDMEHGKKAITKYKVLQRKGNKTLVLLIPLTGRTHQLRIHAAHPNGLNHPIIGDELYGEKADCLYLHAAELNFIHPITGKPLTIFQKADFLL